MKLLLKSFKITIQLFPIFIFGYFILNIGACTYDKGEIPTDTLDNVCDTLSATYDANIGAIVNTSCAISNCHEAGCLFGDFTTYAGLKAKVDDGKVEDRVIDEKSMPPSYATPLTDEDFQLISCWLENGALEN